MTRRNPTNSAFGTSVSNALAEANVSQRELADRVGASPSHLNQVLTGRKKPNAGWADLVAGALRLQDEQRKQLHYAAAKDLGFDLDLTKG